MTFLADYMQVTLPNSNIPNRLTLKLLHKIYNIRIFAMEKKKNYEFYENRKVYESNKDDADGMHRCDDDDGL